MPIGTVMSRLSRGKAQLRLALEAAERGETGKLVSFPGNKEAKRA